MKYISVFTKVHAIKNDLYSNHILNGMHLLAISGFRVVGICMVPVSLYTVHCINLKLRARYSCT